MSDIQQITSKLWEMANDLRGSMDASEYKNYILAFMFYRYLSEHQENYLLNEDILDIEDGESVNDAYIREASGEDLADYLEDISSSLGYAINPNDTWTSLIGKVNNSEIIPEDYQNIFDNFNSNCQLNANSGEDFSGIFSDINLGDSRLGSSINERTKSLNGIVNLINDVNFKSDDGKDILGEIYEYLIGQFAANAGKKGGEFYTPHQVSNILAKIVTCDVDANDEAFYVYDPTMGSGSLLLTVGQQLDCDVPIKYYGQEKNTTTYNLARMNLMMHDVSYKNMDLINADTLESDCLDRIDENGIDQPRVFDAIVANPPYSQKWDNDSSKLKDPRFSGYGKLAPKSRADYAFLLHSLYHLNETGTMAIILPHGVLFRGGAEEKIRKTLIEKNYLDTVLGVPANLFYGTSIPTVILVLRKNRQNRDILFIDASKEFKKGKNQNELTDEHIDKIIKTYKDRCDVDKYAHVVSFDEIEENDFNLNIPRYVDTFEDEEPIDLDEVLANLKEDDEKIAKLEDEINEQLKILGVIK